MRGMVGRDWELEQIVGLCRALATLGVMVSMSDARPAVMVPDASHPWLVVTVSSSGDFFEWSYPRERHPAADRTGAAARIAHHLDTSSAGLGEMP
jgi:hypothetical protein